MHQRYAQCRADRVVASAHWHICLPHLPSRHQSKQKSQCFAAHKRTGMNDKTSHGNKLIRYMIQLHGHWTEGYALDLHTVSSTPIRELKTVKVIVDGQETEMQVYGEITGWDNVYTEIGELMNRLKYRGEQYRVNSIAEIAANFLRNRVQLWNLRKIIPVPPSRLDRPFQPVQEIARAIGHLINIPVDNQSLRKVRATPQMIGIHDVQERRNHLQNAFAITQNTLNGQNVLLIDDLYRSGETLNAITDVLMNTGRASNVYVLTITKTRSNR